MIRFRSRSDDLSCPVGWEITRALSHPETSADVFRHMRDCPTCTQLAAELRTVISAAAEMPPVAPMSQAARERIRYALRAAGDEAAAPSDGRRRVRLVWVFAAGLAGFVVALGGWLTAGHLSAPPQLAQRPAGPMSLVKIHTFGDAKLRRVSPPPDEIVHLESGRVAFEVAHLTSDQRFRVVTGDGEVEVRGTRFETVAREGALWAVVVTEGRVDVRVGNTVQRLQAGDEWERRPPIPTVDEPAVAAPVTLESPRVHKRSLGSRLQVASSTVQPGKARPASRENKESFDLAWSYLRRREWDKAESGFADVAAQTHGQTLEEDALYWQAVATARAGRTREANQLFEMFLQRFPAGARTGAATLALAWFHLDAGEQDKARGLFERAAQDSSLRVREGAKEGLSRLQAR
jgi:hypothetical protein